MSDTDSAATHSRFVHFWLATPTIVRAVVAGIAVAFAGTVPWAILSSLNFKYAPNIPWAVPLTGGYLFAFWWYLNGGGPPRASAVARRRSLRANPLTPSMWSVSLLAGILGLATFVAFQRVLARMVSLPAQSSSAIPHISVLSLFFFLLMGALVAGVAEEAAYRGYLQGPIERRHGPFVAIGLTGLLFGFAHFTHLTVGLALLPSYLLIASVYGALAWLTNSIFPSLVLHSAGNFLSGLGLLFASNSVPKPRPAALPKVWQTGVDQSFVLSCIVFSLLVVVTIGAYLALARVCRKESNQEESPSY